MENQNEYSEIILSSNKRNFGTNENPVFILDKSKLIQKYKVKSVQIPISYYLINNTNNKIYFTENRKNNIGVNVATDCVATITNGNYTITTLIAEIKSVMETASFNSFTYTVEDLESTNKIKITQSDGNTFMFDIDATNDKIYFSEHTSTPADFACTATLTTGSYNLADFLTEIGDAMTTASHETGTYVATKPADKLVITLTPAGTETFDITLASKTNVPTYYTGLTLIDYTAANPTTGTNNMVIATVISYSLIFLSKENTAWYIMGFTKNTDTSAGLIATSPNTYDLSGNKLINVGCSNLNSGVNYLNSYYNVISSVPITNSFNEISYFENNGDYININQHVSQISLFLKNQLDNDVDLNDKTWNIILQIFS